MSINSSNLQDFLPKIDWSDRNAVDKMFKEDYKTLPPNEVFQENSIKSPKIIEAKPTFIPSPNKVQFTTNSEYRLPNTNLINSIKYKAHILDVDLVLKDRFANGILKANADNLEYNINNASDKPVFRIGVFGPTFNGKSTLIEILSKTTNETLKIGKLNTIQPITAGANVYYSETDDGTGCSNLFIDTEGTGAQKLPEDLAPALCKKSQMVIDLAGDASNTINFNGKGVVEKFRNQSKEIRSIAIRHKLIPFCYLNSDILIYHTTLTYCSILFRDDLSKSLASIAAQVSIREKKPYLILISNLTNTSGITSIEATTENFFETFKLHEKPTDVSKEKPTVTNLRNVLPYFKDIKVLSLPYTDRKNFITQIAVLNNLISHFKQTILDENKDKKTIVTEKLNFLQMKKSIQDLA